MQMSVYISEVTFEHHRQAFGIGECRPRLSWRFGGDGKNWIQQGYEVGVSIGCEPEGIFPVQSSASVLVAWPARSLWSREAALVRVRAFGQDGLHTAWSDGQTVEIGLLSADEWKCALIEAPQFSSPELPKRPILMRRKLNIPKKISKARLYSTAHGLYEANINGQVVGDHVLDPGWTSYAHRLPYQTFDVTDLLTVGSNAIGVIVGEGWWAGRLGIHGGCRNIWGDAIGFIGQIIVTYEDGSEDCFPTDPEWTASTGGIIRSEVYDGEHYDARSEVRGWCNADFDDSNWKAVAARPISSFAETLVPSDGPPIRRIQIVEPVSVFRSPKGKVLVDFGQNLVGWLRVSVQGPEGHTISFQHVEVLEHNEAGTRPLWGAEARDTLVLGIEPLQWEPTFTYHGFRYVEITGWPSEDGLPYLKDIEAVVIHTDMERTGFFECSDPLLNKLHQNVVWSMRGNFVSLPTDCPQRGERLGWTGDIQAFGPTATFLYSCTGLLKSWLKDVSAEQHENGGAVPPLVVPDVLSKHPTFATRSRKSQAVWGDVAISLPWTLYGATGDCNILSEQYQSMQSWIDRGIPRKSNSLWDVSDHPQLADWLDPSAPPQDPANGETDPEFVANAFLIGMTDLMTKISTVIDKPEESIRYQSVADAMKREFQAEYITPHGRVSGDSQTALALAIYFTLFASGEQARKAGDRLVHIIRSKARFKIATGFVGTPILGHALTAVGQNQIFYRMLMHRKNPSWLYPVTMGATTIWERWDSMLPDGSINPGQMTSFNHYALGSIADWMHKVIGGLSAAEPGWRKIRVAPIPGGGLTRAKISHNSPYGWIKINWRIEASCFTMKVVVPPNTTAVIELPGIGGQQEVGSGEHELHCVYEELEWPPKPLYGAFYRNKGDDDVI